MTFNISTSKRSQIIGAISLIVLIAVFCLIWSRSRASPRPYSLVYLSSGEMYVGHLSAFPSLTLRDAYLLHRASTPATGQETTPATDIQLTPLSTTVWAPAYLKINRDQVIFSGPLRTDSKAMQAIRSQTK